MNSLAQLMRRYLSARGIVYCGTDEALLSCTSINASLARKQAALTLSAPA